MSFSKTVNSKKVLFYLFLFEKNIEFSFENNDILFYLLVALDHH